MADKKIGELPDAVKIYDLPNLINLMDDTLIAVENQGTAYKLAGSVYKQYAIQSAKEQADNAQKSAEAAKGSEDRAKESENKAKASEEEATKQATKAEEYSGNPAIPNPETGNWDVWNADTKEYQDSGETYRGNILFAAFEVDPQTGELYMYTDTDYNGPQFALNGPDLEVDILHA